MNLVITVFNRICEGNVGDAKMIAGDYGFKINAIAGESAMDRINLPE